MHSNQVECTTLVNDDQDQAEEPATGKDEIESAAILKKSTMIYLPGEVGYKKREEKEDNKFRYSSQSMREDIMEEKQLDDLFTNFNF